MIADPGDYSNHSPFRRSSKVEAGLRRRKSGVRKSRDETGCSKAFVTLSRAVLARAQCWQPRNNCKPEDEAYFRSEAREIYTLSSLEIVTSLSLLDVFFTSLAVHIPPPVAHDYPKWPSRLYDIDISVGAAFGPSGYW